jgi:hypothetical protein
MCVGRIESCKKSFFDSLNAMRCNELKKCCCWNFSYKSSGNEEEEEDEHLKRVALMELKAASSNEIEILFAQRLKVKSNKKKKQVHPFPNASR